MSARSVTADALPNHEISPDAAEGFTWRPLRIFCIYRLAVAFGITVIYLTTQGGEVMVTARPTVFLATALAYLAVAAVLFIPLSWRQPPFQWQVNIQVAVDLVALSTLIFASGSVDNGLATLLLVAVAGGSILAGMRMGALFAAAATIALFLQQIYLQLQDIAPPLGFPQVGFLGLATFATALVGGWLANRARENQALAARRGIDIENLQALNNHIVQRLQIGVVVLDTDGRIRLTNRAARDVLGCDASANRLPIQEVAPELARAHGQWLETWEAPNEPLPAQRGRGEYMPRFRPIGPNGGSGTLIFLENLAEIQAQIQQAKLASLGRLTASIAHEIRNPLGAISNAGQLLEEADHLTDGDKRLVEIVRNQCSRLNTVIESVLQLSRRQAAEQSRIQLDDWLQRFVNDWREQQDPNQQQTEVSIAADRVMGWFDPEQLTQVLDNLLRNAAEHGGYEGRTPRVHLVTDYDDSGRPFIEVQDNGGGIPEELREQLFEPFFTTSSRGTGLGLYLCREICEANQARLELMAKAGVGACFRITFAGPHREEAMQ